MLANLRASSRAASPFTRISLALGLAFVLLVALRLHGFSLAGWDAFLEGDQNSNLLGEAQGVRSDDWIALLPALASQASPEQRLGNPSALLGYESVSPLAYTPLPVLSWQLLFRPFHWGYLLGAEIGISWHWWSRIFLLLGAMFYLARLWLGSAPGLCLAAALIFAFSPFFSFWSYCMEPVFAWAVLTIALAEEIFRGKRSGWWGLGLAYAMAALAFGGFYPPFQIPALHVVLAVVLGAALNRAQFSGSREVRGPSLIFLAAGVASLVLFALHLWSQADALALLAKTDYPGQRLSLGGGADLARVLPTNFTIFSRRIDWSPLGNIAEASGFLLFLPVTIVLIWREKLYRDRRILALLVLVLGYHFRNFLGLPKFLNVATGLSFVPENRLVAGYGFADFLLTLLVLAQMTERKASLRKPTFLLALVFWALVVFAARAPLPDFYTARRVVPSVLVLALLSHWLAHGQRRLFLTTLAALTVLKGATFNPLAYRGLEQIRHAPLSVAILAEQSCRKWASFGPLVYGNLFRILGVPSAGGVQFSPHFSLWRNFDPAGISRATYNRYGHAVFALGSSATQAPSISNPQDDVILLTVHPDSREWLATDVNCLLVPAETSARFEHWREVREVAGWRIYLRSEIR